MTVKIEASWKTQLSNEFEKPYFSTLIDFIKNEYKNNIIYPPGNQTHQQLTLKGKST